jgi:hypothetical protein
MTQDEIKVGDLVKWTSQSGGYARKKVGILVGITHHNDTSKRHYIDHVCDLSLAPKLEHKFMFDVYLDAIGPHVWSRSRSYFVSVKVGKTGRAKRGLYHPRRVELAGESDEDGVWLV